ncbi:TIGR01777 family oxidoreductase [Oceanospirillum linum]|uniref:TIGR01777 family protein n=1 Tax=Oceanospirillum linum TaxID=966 RepID=A0A1T1HBD5_OCELI|nr:TIGR01777 family oxidoreductase [Oceanospirillum linum]OOV87178.1 TIGR01777 family protein [Oceanospirillum linum]SEF77065.1 hypothetical protein SAMN04489856_102256 [Oleiphilus messinensis]SMP17676.1 hypothetical protein SAMN06264348_103254 [Oceanospirillum linum]
MNIMLTGGTGFIGKALCHRLLDEGHVLYVVSRWPDQVNSIIGRPVNAASDPLQWLGQPIDVMINLAGAPIADARWSDARKDELLQSRLRPTRQLVRFAEEAGHKPKVLISGSAIGFYGAHGDDEVTELSAAHDEFAHRLCVEWETEALAAEQSGVRVCLLRTGLVLGPDGGMLDRLLTPFKLGLGGRLGSGQHYMPWIHREDLVNIILFLIQRDDMSGAFNGAAPTPVRNATFSRILAGVLKRPMLMPVPAWLLKLALGELSQMLLTGAKVVPYRLEKAGFVFQYPTVRPALAQILER